MTTPVSFPLAKLLKEKGFDKPCCSRYWVGYEKEEHLQIECLSNNYNDYDDDSTIYYSAPTIAEVVMWLYEKHGIWISAHSTRGYFVGNWIIHNTSKGGDTDVFNSPTEAYEAAIEYVLTHPTILNHGTSK